jgi:acetolactate synthase small subunit
MVDVEAPHAGEYADYVFKVPQPRLVVEAKKEGTTFEVPAGVVQRERKLASLMKDNPMFTKAIEQVALYCTDRGIALACACNGHQLVAFVAARDDGVPWREGRALVFTSLEQMLANFRELWDALSSPAVERGTLDARLIGEGTIPPPPPLAESIPGYPGLRSRNAMQATIEDVAPTILTEAAESDALDEALRKEWYVETRKIRQGADTVRRALQAKYDAPFDIGSPTPILESAEHIGKMFQDAGRRPIVLLGDVGTGKSTMLRRIIEEERHATLRPLISIHVDLGVDTVSERNMREVLATRIADVLREKHHTDIDAAGFVRAVYHPELQHMALGIEGELRQIDEVAYKRLEIEELRKLKDTRVEHVRRSLAHLVASYEAAKAPRIVLILDNADQRQPDVQREAFMTAQAVAAKWPVAVILAMRPDTFHASRRSGVLAAYHAQAFAVTAPAIRRVLERRLAFAMRLATGELVLPSLKQVRVNIPTLAGVIAQVKRSVSEVGQVRDLIEAIASGNVRVALEVLIDLVTSPHISPEWMLEKAKSSPAPLRLHHALQAVALRDKVYYTPSGSRIANLFAVSTREGREHFVLPLLISWIASTSAQASAGFVATPTIYSTLQSLGFTRRQIAQALDRALEFSLLETGTREPSPAGLPPLGYRAREVGLFHVRELVTHFLYVDLVLVDTPILDDTIRSLIQDVKAMDERLDRAERFREYLDAQWQRLPLDASTIFNWPQLSQRLASSISWTRVRYRESMEKHAISGANLGSDGETGALIRDHATTETEPPRT